MGGILLSKRREHIRSGTLPGSVLAVRYDMVNGREGPPWEYRFYDTQDGELISSISNILSLNFAADGSFMLLVDDQEQLGLYRTSDVIGKSVPSVVSVEPSGKMITLLGRIKQTQLLQNYPNPFNPETWIPFAMSRDEHVTISIYSSTGQLVRTLDLGQKPSGAYMTREKAAYWDGRNEEGETVASDTYFYVMQTGAYTNIRKMAVAR